MIRVKNRKAIVNLSRKSLKANRTRNLVAVAAIALTTLLFTALFTIAISINEGFQQSNFRQAGGWNHATFKYLTEAQYNDLKTDPEIKEWGLRRFVGMPEAVPFNKDHVEIGFYDAFAAHWSYCDPTEGNLPREGTDEAAADLHVLELMGVEPKLGAQFTVDFTVDGKPTTQTFTLCGWWPYDEAVAACNIVIPESRVDAILAELGVDPDTSESRAGTRNLNVMFENSWNIAGRVEDILARHGYQEGTAGGTHIATGVNWGYTGSQLGSNMDAGTMLAVAAMLALIIVTGYLIIYNVFQISVVNDIRFYGMLKTIGTTPRQLRRIIRRQALVLSAFGIPLGLGLGWGTGALLVPVILAQLSGVVRVVSVNPAVFLLSAAFALATVLLSCARPGRMAGRVSPIEALRYTEGGAKRRSAHKTRRTAGISLPRMAWVNLGRSRSKTVVTVLSLSLAVMLLTMTVTFTNGFSMEKYLARFVSTDFILADASHFQTSSMFNADAALPRAAAEDAAAQPGVTAGGCAYGKAGMVTEGVTEAYYRAMYSRWYDADAMDKRVANEARTDTGLLKDNAQLYGMEPFVLDKLTVLEGSLADLYTPGSRSIAAVYATNDYGELKEASHWAKLGDTVPLEYVDEFDYVDPTTGAPVDPASGADYTLKILRSHTVVYTVTALVTVPRALSYRYYGADEFVLNADTFIKDTGSDRILYYACDTTAESRAAMEAYLADYTKTQNPACDYESRLKSEEDFAGFRNMFLLLGGALSFIVGLVGVLNFFNAVLTGILTRRREFAMLQSIGMTGRQLNTMLMWEGLLYAASSLLLALVLTVATGPILARALESMIWFFSYRLTVTPILVLLPVFALLGVLLPLVSYHSMARQTLVERLKTGE